MAADLKARPAAQAGYLVGALVLWAVVYVLWVHWLSGIAVEGAVSRRIVYAVQSTLYIVFPVAILLPVTVVRIGKGVLAGGIVLAAALLVAHLSLPKGTILYHLTRDMSLLLAAVLVGGVVGWGVGENRHIVPAFVVLFVVDVWSVFRGVSLWIVERPEVTEHVVIGSPVVGYPGPGLPVIGPLLGPADVLILVASIALSVKFRLGVARSVVYLAGGLLAGFLFVAFLGRPLPMLPFLVVSFVLAHFRKLELDWRQVVAAVLFSFGLVAVLTVVSMMMSRGAPAG